MTNLNAIFEAFQAEPWRDLREHMPYLREIAYGTILEIGVHIGQSTCSFLCGLEKNGGHLYSIDNDKIVPALEHIGPHPQWTFISGDSKDTSLIPVNELDVLFIDGDHTYEGVSADIRNYMPMVKPGGLMLMHDVEGHPERHINGLHFLGVERAFEEISRAYLDWNPYIRPGSWGLGVLQRPIE